MTSGKSATRSKVKSVLQELRRGAAITNADLEARLGMPASDVKRRHPGNFNTSLNQDRAFVTHQAYVEKHCDRLGFLTINDGRFHTKGNAQDALLHLIWKQPMGLTRKEADELLQRDCGRALTQLVEEKLVHTETIHGDVVYLHPKRWQLQVKQRTTNPRFAPDEVEGEKPDPEAVLELPDVLATFRELAPQLTIPGLTVEEGLAYLSAYLLKLHYHDSYRSLERRIRVDPRIREACHFPEAPDHMALWRGFDATPVEDVQALFTRVVRAGVNVTVHGKYLVVDATHALAWASTRRTIEDGDVEGAAWGHHEGSFYGYKVHLLVDAEAELPLAVVFTPGNVHDRNAYALLLDDLQQRLPAEVLEGVLGVSADAAYYDEELRVLTLERLHAPLNAAINPRRNRFLKTIKNQIRELLRRCPGLSSVQDVLAKLNQRFLHQYGVDVGTMQESAILGAIRDALNRRLRVAVERVFSRAKTLLPFETSRSKDWPRVMKHFLLCFVWMHLVALTAHRVGQPGNALSLTRIV